MALAGEVVSKEILAQAVWAVGYHPPATTTRFRSTSTGCAWLDGTGLGPRGARTATLSAPRPAFRSSKGGATAPARGSDGGEGLAIGESARSWS